jgi:hypothetical protein
MVKKFSVEAIVSLDNPMVVQPAPRVKLNFLSFQYNCIFIPCVMKKNKPGFHRSHQYLILLPPLIKLLIPNGIMYLLLAYARKRKRRLPIG